MSAWLHRLRQSLVGRDGSITRDTRGVLRSNVAYAQSHARRDEYGEASDVDESDAEDVTGLELSMVADQTLAVLRSENGSESANLDEKALDAEPSPHAKRLKSSRSAKKRNAQKNNQRLAEHGASVADSAKTETTETKVLDSARVVTSGYYGNASERIRDVPLHELATYDRLVLNPKQPTIVTDAASEHTLIVVSGQLNGIDTKELEKATIDLCDSTRSDKPTHRGGHENRSYGCHCQYTKHPTLVRAGAEQEDSWRAFFGRPVVQSLNKLVASITKAHFPVLASRIAQDPKITLKDGSTFMPFCQTHRLLCINGRGRADAKSGRVVQCRKHIDHKNFGCCVMYANGEYDASLYNQLVFDDLRLIVDVPANCLVIYPSGLLWHYNVHWVDVQAAADAHNAGLPRPDPSTPPAGMWRRSYVWFNQAALQIRLDPKGKTRAQANAGKTAAQRREETKAEKARNVSVFCK